MTSRRDLGRLAAGLLPALALATVPPRGFAAAPEAVRAVYLGFLAAQNDRDLARVRASLWDSPDFLWVSDGRPYWGPDALVERMGRFQTAEVWRVEPDLKRGRVVEVAPGAAYLSLPLTLVIGAAANPQRLGWLVGVLCREGDEGWRIAALFTTTDKSS